MAKEIIPHKQITSYDENGEVKDVILQYRIREDGKMSNQFFTKSVKNSLDLEQVNATLAAGKADVETKEGISVAPIKIKEIKL